MPRTRKPKSDAITCLDDCVEVIQPNQKYLTTEEEDGHASTYTPWNNNPTAPRWKADGSWIASRWTNRMNAGNAPRRPAYSAT
jgi:hypothetical protein